MAAIPKNAPVQIPHRPHGFRMRIPWRIHLKAHEEYAKKHHQAADRLAKRGGFGLMELIYLLAGEDPYAIGGKDDQMFTDFFNRWPEEDKP